MRIMAVDDEPYGLDGLMRSIRQAEPDAELTGFTKSSEAFHYLSTNAVDIAFLDIEMGEFSGIALAQKCKDICPTVNIIFVTGYSQYTMDAFKLHASGYLMKPVRLLELKEEIKNLRYPVPQQADRRVRVQTFGNFEVFVDGALLDIPRSKSRECFAYLIDRKGARVSTQELAGILWEDKQYDKRCQNNTHRVVTELMKALKSAGVQDIVIKSHRSLAIDVNKVDCDYYEAVSGNTSLKNTFTGEYMSNYSWAEFTLGDLNRRFRS